MKQKHILLSFGASFLAITLLLAVLFGISEKTILPHTAVDTSPIELPVILLDAGHGGEDSGAVGTSGVLEKELNLSLSQDLAALLRLAGYPVVETRTEDRLLYTEGTKKGHKKQGDLTNRLKFTEQYPNSIFISIHMNTYPLANCEGVQVWYSQNTPASKEWAQAVQDRVTALLQPQNHRRIKAANSSIYILHHAKTPALLIECGFLSTPAECERLCDPAYRQKLVLALFSAISEKYPQQS